ncbi:MAG: hypothetical protein ABJC66_13940 [Gammaproteobacteria bacterium]
MQPWLHVARYPKAEHIVVASDVERAYSKRFGTLNVTFTGFDGMVDRLAKLA